MSSLLASSTASTGSTGVCVACGGSRCAQSSSWSRFLYNLVDDVEVDIVNADIVDADVFRNQVS